MNADTDPLPLAGLPLAQPARHAEDRPPEQPASRKMVEWPSNEPDDFGFEAPEVDPFADTASLGLQKFNIGTVPASVTPPATAKRAAWFSVAASAGALVSLVAISSALVGPPKSTDQIGALPGVPTYSGEPSFEGEMPPDALRDPPGRDDGPTTTGPTGGRHRAPEAGPGHQQVRQPPGPQGAAGNGRTGSPVPDNPGRGAPGGPPGSGSRTITPAPPAEAPPPEVIIAEDRNQFIPSDVDGQQMANRSERYLERVATDPAAAHEMTGGDLRDEGVDGIRERYRGVRDIQVRTIYSDPNRAVTENEVTITKRDGRSITQRRTLRFTPTENPKITADE